MTPPPSQTTPVAAPRWLRAAFVGLGAFDGLTLCWIVGGLAAGGDYFAQGSPLMWVTLVAATAAGGWLGLRVRSRLQRLALALAALGFALFWVAVPDGWWALPPPRPSAPKAALGPRAPAALARDQGSSVPGGVSASMRTQIGDAATLALNDMQAMRRPLRTSPNRFLQSTVELQPG